MDTFTYFITNVTLKVSVMFKLILNFNKLVFLIFLVLITKKNLNHLI